MDRLCAVGEEDAINRAAYAFQLRGEGRSVSKGERVLSFPGFSPRLRETEENRNKKERREIEKKKVEQSAKARRWCPSNLRDRLHGHCEICLEKHALLDLLPKRRRCYFLSQRRSAFPDLHLDIET